MRYFTHSQLRDIKRRGTDTSLTLADLASADRDALYPISFHMYDSARASVLCEFVLNAGGTIRYVRVPLAEFNLLPEYEFAAKRS